MEITTSSDTEGVKFDRKDLKMALRSLSLTWAPVGDYLVIMNGESDVDICGEPYLAMQIWLNLRSGKFISRLWNQTIATGTAVSIAHFLAACEAFQRKPCVGCPVAPDEVNTNGYTILHSPMPRKVSLWCRKFLKNNEGGSQQACPECTSLKGSFIKNEDGVNEIDIVMKAESQFTNENDGTIDNSSSYVNQCTSHDMVKSETTSDTLESGLRFKNHHVSLKKIVTKRRPKVHNPLSKRRPWAPGKCKWCDQRYTKYKSWWQHAQKTHFMGKFHCPQCHQREDLASELVIHMKEALHGLDDNIVCPNCKIGKSLQAIETHYRECLKSKFRVELDSRRKVISGKVCDKCGKTLTKYAYKDHMKVHLREELAQKQEDASHLFYYCDQCGKRFTNKAYLNGHIKSEHENFTYQCPECPMTFKTDMQSRTHRMVAHTDMYKCKYCGKCCPTPQKLKVHEMYHMDAQFQCRHCDKKLKTEESLLAHERIHTGEKPFSCKICTASFTNSSGLRQHMRGVHKIAGIKGGKVGWTRKEK